MTENTTEETNANAGGYTGAGIKIGDVTEVIDPVKDLALIHSWYEDAEKVDGLYAFGKLSERLLGRYSHTPATTPHAYACIALAALKMADRSEQGNMDEAGWSKVLWNIVQALTGTQNEPLGLIRYADFLYPEVYEKYKNIPPDIWQWMRENATVGLIDPELKDAPEEVKKHWESIVKGEVPYGLKIGPTVG